MKKPPNDSDKIAGENQIEQSEQFTIHELGQAIKENDDLRELGEEARKYVHVAYEEAAKQDILPRRLLAIHHYIRHSADMFLEEVVAKEYEVACKAGCNFCCNMRVSASPLEVFTIAAGIKKSWPPQEIESLRETLRKNVEKMRKLNTEEHFRAKIPCPLLKDGKCSVYASRPLNCRKWFSYSKERCETAFNGGVNGNIEVSTQGYIWGHILALGISDWLKHNGLDNDEYELQSSLLVALDNFGTIDEWMAGKKVFADCIRPGWKGQDS